MSITMNGVVKSHSVRMGIRRYFLQASTASAAEGTSVTFTLTTTLLPNGTEIPYTISGVDSADLSGAPLAGNFVINNNTAQVTYNITADALTEGAETLTLTIAGGSVSIIINDTSMTPTYSLSSSVAAVNEGGSFVVTLDTEHVANGTVIPYTITGVTAADLVDESLTGSFEVTGNTASKQFTVAADLLTEGTEIFTLTLAQGLGSISVTLNDTSMTPTYSLSRSAAAVNEGESFTVTLTTTSLPNGYLVPYTVTGVSSADLSGAALTGNFTINNNTAQIILTAAADNTTEGYETATINLNGGLGSVAVGINDTSIQITTLNNPNVYDTSAYDQFGTSVAISGNYAVIGAPSEDEANGANSGKAYVFDVTTGALVRTLNNPNAYGTSGGDQFGSSVAVNGNYAVVGAPGEDDASGNGSGKAYVFDVTTGALVRTLNNPNAYDTSANDQFGTSVAISGNYAVIGAPSEDEANGTNSGKAYVFDVTTGALVRTLNNPNAYGTRANDQFGQSVAVNGNYAVVGAPYEGDAGGASSGKAYVFDVTTGALVHILNNPNAYDTSGGDLFGQSVAVNGNYAVVGAPGEDDAGGANSGKAYVFAVTTGALVHILNNPNAYDTSAYDQFGTSVAISGNYAVVSAVYEDDANGTSSGKAYVFDVTTGALVRTLNNPNAYGTSLNDRFGQSVAVNGNYAVVGAPGEGDAGGTNSGKAYIFKLFP